MPEPSPRESGRQIWSREMLSPHWTDTPDPAPPDAMAGARVALWVGAVVALAATTLAVLGSLMAR